jgi:uncharacterized membrane protein
MKATARRDSGQASVLVFGMILVLLAVGGLVFDGSRAFLARRNLQNALDAAVLAGAARVSVEQWKTSAGASLELKRDDAVSTAQELFRQNAPPHASASFDVEGTVIRGVARSRVDFVFLTLVGISGYDIDSAASASPAFIGGG